MADKEVMVEVSKIMDEWKKVLLSIVAILEEIQGQNPTTWDQLLEMMKTAAESSDLEERKQNLFMCLRSSFVALGINPNYSYNVNGETVNGETVVDINRITKKWIDDKFKKDFLHLLVTFDDFSKFQYAFSELNLE